MDKLIRTSLKLAMVVSCFAIAASAQAQPTAQPAGGTTQTVNAQQSGVWNVGVSNSESAPIPVKVVGGPSARQPFQARLLVNIAAGSTTNSGSLPIPAGKRLVIENISAVARTPAGVRMDMNFNTYMDNDRDGEGGLEDITFHRIALIDQGTYSTGSVASANHDVLVFAEEQIGTGHYGITLTARMTDITGPGQAQVTFSGYLEDLPPIP